MVNLQHLQPVRQCPLVWSVMPPAVVSGWTSSAVCDHGHCQGSRRSGEIGSGPVDGEEDVSELRPDEWDWNSYPYWGHKRGESMQLFHPWMVMISSNFKLASSAEIVSGHPVSYQSTFVRPGFGWVRLDVRRFAFPPVEVAYSYACRV